MMDVSLGKQEKEMYIVSVRLNEAGKSYIVTYADGHQVEESFSVHNYCAYQYRMKQQFLDNKGKFVDTLEYMQAVEIIKEFKTIILSMAGVVLVTGVNTPKILEVIVLSLIGIYNAGSIISKLIKIWIYRKLKQGANNVEEFVREMEHYTIPVIDPNTGKEEDWYYYNISDAYPYTDPKTLQFLSAVFTDEFKKEESERISKALKRSFTRTTKGSMK